MPILSSLQNALPSWEATKSTSKKGFDHAWAALDKLGAPVNKISNKLGSEAFWPSTMDKESDKAARILRSFVKDGFYAELDKETDTRMTPQGPKGKQRVVKKIPTEVIKNAKGLAIFTVCRTGLWVSGAGGSGVLVARLPNGEWSPPSGILLHTAGLGFLVGIDIYDCVVVINTEDALKAFTKVRCTLGGEVSAVAGPVGVGGILETEIHKRQAPIWTYLKSRGFYAGIQVDGTIIIERTDENEKFYGERIGVLDILAGKVRHPPREIQTLSNTIKYAQGDKDVDESVLPDAKPTPGDLSAQEVLEQVDLDPLGVKALEQEGVEIKEAGSHRRVSSEEFMQSLSPKSPTFNQSTRGPPPALPPRELKTDTPTIVEEGTSSKQEAGAIEEAGSSTKQQEAEAEAAAHEREEDAVPPPAYSVVEEPGHGTAIPPEMPSELPATHEPEQSTTDETKKLSAAYELE
ncbi:MAG: hypothetical protein MMC33_007431 [Icmadophila ericetorum]|nr:hypothetical protein [Icmadophila ericetorum]